MSRILIVEDEEHIADGLRYTVLDLGPIHATTEREKHSRFL